MELPDRGRGDGGGLVGVDVDVDVAGERLDAAERVVGHSGPVGRKRRDEGDRPAAGGRGPGSRHPGHEPSREGLPEAVAHGIGDETLRDGTLGGREPTAFLR